MLQTVQPAPRGNPLKVLPSVMGRLGAEITFRPDAARTGGPSPCGCARSLRPRRARPAQGSLLCPRTGSSPATHVQFDAGLSVGVTVLFDGCLRLPAAAPQVFGHPGIEAPGFPLSPDGGLRHTCSTGALRIRVQGTITSLCRCCSVRADAATEAGARSGSVPGRRAGRFASPAWAVDRVREQGTASSPSSRPDRSVGAAASCRESGSPAAGKITDIICPGQSANVRTVCPLSRER